MRTGCSAHIGAIMLILNSWYAHWFTGRTVKLYYRDTQTYHDGYIFTYLIKLIQQINVCLSHDHRNQCVVCCLEPGKHFWRTVMLTGRKISCISTSKSVRQSLVVWVCFCVVHIKTVRVCIESLVPIYTCRMLRSLCCLFSNRYRIIFSVSSGTMTNVSQR